MGDPASPLAFSSAVALMSVAVSMSTLALASTLGSVAVPGSAVTEGRSSVLGTFLRVVEPFFVRFWLLERRQTV